VTVSATAQVSPAILFEYKYSFNGGYTGFELLSA